METNLKTWQRVVIGLGLPSLICLVFLYMWSGIYGLRCFFYELTDLYCPGCGSSRALSSLLHGDWKGAFTHNVLVLPLGAPATAVFLHEYDHRGRANEAHQQREDLVYCWDSSRRTPADRGFRRQHVTIILPLSVYEA